MPCLPLRFMVPGRVSVVELHSLETGDTRLCRFQRSALTFRGAPQLRSPG